MAEMQLTPPVFAIFSSLIEERVGLCYPLQDAEILASKLSLRALELGFGSLLDYYYFLRYDADSEQEFTTLVNTLVVNETFFFRELAPLRVMVSEVVAPLVRAGKKPRIWSAACSTGEEPLTLAMLLEDQGLLSSVELIATDVSSNVLARATSGSHSRRSLRQATVPHLVDKWLGVSEHAISVRPELLHSISFRQLNLLDRAAVEALGVFDLILCRNVLIYFRDSTAARVVGSLADQLRPQGVLLVGISESLLRFDTQLNCEENSGVFLYRKSGS
jgi:chemotaxis protein methyltransferase CheR